jgi:hypothetical protein
MYALCGMTPATNKRDQLMAMAKRAALCLRVSTETNAWR